MNQTTTTGRLIKATVRLAPERTITIEGRTYVLVPLDALRAQQQNTTGNPR